ncbi:MAG: GMC oxidoreductase [Gemmatimonadales bacterium]
MDSDARTVQPGTELECDICIVGSGPAGISIASAFIGSTRDVVVLESGGARKEQAAQELNEGTVEGDPYAGLRKTRHRQLGGTVNIWNTPVTGRIGGKFVPLDARDLERDDGHLAAWPFGFGELTPWYKEAHAFCGLGPFVYDAESWRGALGSGPDLGPSLVNQVFQFGRTEQLVTRYLRSFTRAGNIRICHHATVRGLITNRGGRRVIGVDVAGGSAESIRVNAGVVVLAAGAIENARLLLLSGDTLALDESRRWVGKCFMEHPRDTSFVFTPHPGTIDEFAFHARRKARDGTVVGGRIALNEKAIAEEKIPGASISLLPPVPERDGVWPALRRRFRPPPPPATFRVLVNLEQAPHPDNQISLGSDRDRLGLPRPVLHWRWSREEQAGLDRLRLCLAKWLGEKGRIEPSGNTGIDPNAHHHSGTTRMHRSPSLGVVDPAGRVHGVDNLYVAGASTFPTSGWANPTLTIVALSLRLADHLRRGM